MPPKKKNGYAMPKPLKTGAILNDTQKGQWKVGVSIGIGGFGEIYSACKVGDSKKIDDYPYVVKIEPKENGPLFVEMHFYNRNARKEDIDAYSKKLKLKTLGMPEYIAMGSHEIEGIKHRFLVLPRLGKDIWKIFLEQNRIFPLHTVYRLGYQVTNVLEYIHNREYVHMDIKGTNILLGFGKGGDEHVFLLDFGLACHYNTKEFKPDPKKMHNGTIEYTSRDAHLGVPTMRGDLEVLAYNLIEWSGAKLPWVEKKLLAKPVEVQKSKEEFMKNFDKSLKAAYGGSTVPGQITAFFKYLVSLNHDTKPDYSKLRGFFETGIKELSEKNTGVLVFGGSAGPGQATKKKPGKPDFGGPSKEPKRGKVQKQAYVDLSDSEDEVVVKPAKKTAKKPEVAKPEVSKKPEVASKKPEISSKKPEVTSKKPEVVSKKPEVTTNKPEVDDTRPPKRNRDKPKRVLSEIDSESEDEVVAAKSPRKEPRARTSPRSTSKENDEESPPPKKTKNKDEKSSKGMITLKSKSTSKGGKKTIQLNFNLDVSLDSDLVVVVNRKDKKKKEEPEAEETPAPGEKWSNAGVYKGKHAKTK